MMEFLYFPEDMSDYLPSVLALILFGLAAIVITRIFVNVSRKEQKKIEKQYANEMAIMNKQEDN